MERFVEELKEQVKRPENTQSIVIDAARLPGVDLTPCISTPSFGAPAGTPPLTSEGVTTQNTLPIPSEVSAGSTGILFPNTLPARYPANVHISVLLYVFFSGNTQNQQFNWRH